MSLRKRARYSDTAASSISPIPRGRSSGTMEEGYAMCVTETRYRGLSHACSLEGADDRGVALAATAAERGGADPTAAATELVDERQNDARARHADGVTECDRATVDVHDVVGDAEVLHRRDTNGRERFVQFEEVDVLGGHVVRLECALDRTRRLSEQRRVGTRDHAVANEFG